MKFDESTMHTFVLLGIYSNTTEEELLKFFKDLDFKVEDSFLNEISFIYKEYNRDVAWQAYEEIMIVSGVKKYKNIKNMLKSKNDFKIFLKNFKEKSIQFN